MDRAKLEPLAVPGGNPLPDDEPEPASIGRRVALDDGDAVLIGTTGWWKHVGEISRSLRWDADSGRWSEIGETYVFIGEPTAVPLWTPRVPYRAGAMAARLPDRRMFVAGGAGPNGWGDSGNNETPMTSAVEAYDPGDGTWTRMPSMPTARTDGAVVVLQDGSVLLVGGAVPGNEAGSIVETLSAIRLIP